MCHIPWQTTASGLFLLGSKPPRPSSSGDVECIKKHLADAFCLREKGRIFGCLVEALSLLRRLVIKILWCSYKKSQTWNFPGTLKRHVQVLPGRLSQALVDFSPADQLYRNQEKWFQGLIYWNAEGIVICVGLTLLPWVSDGCWNWERGTGVS